MTKAVSLSSMLILEALPWLWVPLLFLLNFQRLHSRSLQLRQQKSISVSLLSICFARVSWNVFFFTVSQLLFQSSILSYLKLHWTSSNKLFTCWIRILIKLKQLDLCAPARQTIWKTKRYELMQFHERHAKINW